MRYLSDAKNRETDLIGIDRASIIGVDLASKLIFFSELWKDEMVWYCVLEIDNETNFSIFAKKQKAIVKYEVRCFFSKCKCC